MTVLLFAIATAATDLRKPQTAELLQLWQLALLFVLMALVFLYSDNRYLLPLMPPALALVASSGPMRRPKLGISLTALFVLISLVGLRDHLKYNRALWRAVEHLHTIGVPAREVDGGWAVNGWQRYAHPENAAHAPNGDVMVNWVNEKGVTTRYEITNAARPGWIVENTFPYTRWASRSGAIYVLTH